MPDITMCKGYRCPLKDTCIRYTSKPSKWQSYFLKSPYEKKKCEQWLTTVEKKGI